MKHKVHLMPSITYNCQKITMSKHEYEALVRCLIEKDADNSISKTSTAAAGAVRKIISLYDKAKRAEEFHNNNGSKIKVKHAWRHYEDLGWNFTFSTNNEYDISLMYFSLGKEHIGSVSIRRHPLEKNNHKKSRLYLLQQFEKWLAESEFCSHLFEDAKPTHAPDKRVSRYHEECAGCKLEKAEPPQCEGHCEGPVHCHLFQNKQ